MCEITALNVTFVPVTVLMKTTTMNSSKRPPVWFRLTVAVTIAPLLSWPWLLSGIPSADATMRTLLMCLPAYVMLSGYIAYRTYRERPEVARILIFLVWLSYVAIASLAVLG